MKIGVSAASLTATTCEGMLYTSYTVGKTAKFLDHYSKYDSELARENREAFLKEFRLVRWKEDRQVRSGETSIMKQQDPFSKSFSEGIFIQIGGDFLKCIRVNEDLPETTPLWKYLDLLDEMYKGVNLGLRGTMGLKLENHNVSLSDFLRRTTTKSQTTKTLKKTALAVARITCYEMLQHFIRSPSSGDALKDLAAVLGLSEAVKLLRVEKVFNSNCSKNSCDAYVVIKYGYS